MYIYQITNLINNKIYIGQTNNITKRWSNHRCCNSPNMIIAKAIKKYGINNFKFEVLFKGLSEEEANEKEILLIKEKNCKIPHGYNICDGGNGTMGVQKFGSDNSNSHLTEEEAQYILDNRNIPMYVLYDDFRDKISYQTFKNIYNHKTYTNLEAHSEIYPYNFEFSCQFNNGSVLEYDDIIDIRKRYSNGEYWKNVFQDYKNIYPDEWSFWNVYNGNRFRYVMPEVFSEENKKKHSLLASNKRTGENNGRAKLNKEQVIKIKQLHQNGVSNSDIYKEFPQVSKVSIRNILSGKTWKNI